MRLAVLSDIHGNLDALRAVLEDVDALGIRAVLNLGDVIGYGPDPEECVALVRERDIPTVCGNHEHAMLRPAHKRWFNASAREAVEITESLISPQTRAWCGSLPRALSVAGCRFVHGYPPENMHLYLFNVADERLGASLAALEEDVCFVGHTHDLERVRWDGAAVEREVLAPGLTTLDPGCRYMLNVGSVGQPRDDFDKSAKYAIWDTERCAVGMRFVPYDARATARKIIEAGLPETYAERLL